MAPRRSIAAVLLGQRGHLFPWVPVCLGCGIGLYFALPFEPAAGAFSWLAGLGLIAAALAMRAGPAYGPLAWVVALVAAGACLAAARAHLVAGPVMGWRFYGPVEGRIVGIDRSASDVQRITLDRVRLARVDPGKVPLRVRVSLHGQGGAAPQAGDRVMITAHLSPPNGPVEPGGFDFQRHAWFKRLGAVGYSRTPLMVVAPAPQGEMGVLSARMDLSARVRAGLAGEAGAFAAAIMTGDRAAMSQETLGALRIANLAHLLAISGLHMGLLTGFVFATLRYALVLVPGLGLRLPVKKIAAALALAVAAGYLALSGGNVATERAFVMVAVMLVAVLFDRRALSLRAVAMAAVIVLVLRPESLLGPGFQMSFAATTALVAVFGWLREADFKPANPMVRGITATVLSSAVAGMATAPLAAAHFNQIAHFGLLANLLSVPLMGLLVMPAAVLAALLMPFGLESGALWIMGLGLDWILGVAHYISGLEGARGTVVTPAWPVLPLLGLGFLSMVLWQGRGRFAGAAPILAAIVLWVQTPRPDVLIADGGTLVGVMSPEGRGLSRARGAGFVARNWLENDGDAVNQEGAAQRWQAALKLKAQGLPQITHVTGKKATAAHHCAPGDIVVTNVPGTRWAGCTVFEPKMLRDTGAVALFRTPDGGLRMVTAHEVTGQRLWNRPPGSGRKHARRDQYVRISPTKRP